MKKADSSQNPIAASMDEALSSSAESSISQGSSARHVTPDEVLSSASLETTAEGASRLLSQHQELLDASSISAQVSHARGYRSIQTRKELSRLGFGDSQLRVPALLIPVWSVTGEIANYQSRPDEPRISAKGRAIKYETPKGSMMHLDVHPAIREKLKDRSVPLFITEGVRKADAAISNGLCCVALLGVWNFRGTDEHGGKAALADWEYIPVNDRRVYVVFDNDVMLKAEVYAALARLKSFLETRQARVYPIYLPSGEYGQKIGLDDFLAAGHTVTDLIAHAQADLLPAPGDHTNQSHIPCRLDRNGIYWMTGDLEIQLTNFPAQIVAEVIRDDGAESQRSFLIEARVHGEERTVSVAASQFSSMTWTAELGAAAILFPGLGTRDRARFAIQSLSGIPETRHVYAHTGWRRFEDGRNAYIHAGGAIGDSGALDGVEVDVKGPLSRFELPAPPDMQGARSAILSSLKMLDVVPARIAWPLMAAAWRSVLGGTDFALFLAGLTGQGKSALAALVQQHFGAGLDALHLPGNWSSTDNSLEALAFATKDAVMVVDDFCPTGTSIDVQRLHSKADRIFRGQGNGSGRQRMNKDGSQAIVRPPRGLIIATGEDLPRGQSLQARLLVLQLERGDIDWDRLTQCQRDASGGVYAQAMAAYIHWIAGQYDDIRSRLPEEMATIRQRMQSKGSHRRTSTILAELTIGVRYFLRFAKSIGAVDEAEHDRLLKSARKALNEAAEAQEGEQTAANPARQFLELVASALTSGRAHVAVPDGGVPDCQKTGQDPEAWGWQASQAEYGPKFRSMGNRIGWICKDGLFLDPVASFTVAQQIAHDSGDSIPVGAKTLHRRLSDLGVVKSEDSTRGRHLVRRTIAGVRRNVLHLDPHCLTDSVLSQSTQSGTPLDDSDSDEELEWANRGANSDILIDGSAQNIVPVATKSESDESIDRPIGPVGTIFERSDDVNGVGASEIPGETVGGGVREWRL